MVKKSDNYVKMCDLAVNQGGVVVRVDCFCPRLRELAITEGAFIRCVIASPLGDPKGYDVLGTVIALRSEDVADIYIRAEDSV